MLAQSFTVDLGAPAAQVLVVVFFVIPGLITTWAMERVLGRTTLTGTDRLVRAVTWSVLLYTLASPWLVSLGRRIADGERPPAWEPILGLSIIVFVAPILLALAIVLVRRSVWMRERVDRFSSVDPSATPWDAAFRRGGPFLVRVTLEDGGLVAGFFGSASVASAYPEEPELFLEQEWAIDEHGALQEPVGGSRGILVTRGRIRAAELLDPIGKGS